MKVLLIHSYYNIRGGEDVVFEQEVEFLKKSFEVDILTFHNQKGLVGLLQFVFSIWNILAAVKLRRKIREFRPDIIHLHNWHFACGPLIIRVAKSMHVPILITLHNYRLLCPSATLLKDGKLYLGSLKTIFPWGAVKGKVYKSSRLLTFWLSFIVWFHKKVGTWKMVDKYLTLTQFSKKLFTDSSLGLTESMVSVKPNFVNHRQNSIQRTSEFLFIGRLSTEKGISVLVSAVENTDFLVNVAGEGPLESLFTNVAKNSNLQYRGKLTASEVISFMGGCEALIFPSIWYEGMPMTILEAFSTGTPVIASNLGNMSSMIVDGYNGLLFNPGDPNDLRSKLQYWSTISLDKKEIFRRNAKKTFDKAYTPEVNLEYITAYYNEVLGYSSLAPTLHHKRDYQPPVK